MTKTMSEQFTQLIMSNREKGVFPIRQEMNLKGGSSSSFNPYDVQKVNAVISLRSGKNFDTHMGGKMRMIPLHHHLLSLPLKVVMCFPP